MLMKMDLRIKLEDLEDFIMPYLKVEILSLGVN